ncbi:MAG: LarC family nickel insertion protein, partial [Brachybacterium sp.]|nr:LarC family nickel insertion protein [Brachybacterium sp.]
GACEAWRQLGITDATGSVIAVGSGRIRSAHGDIPVPVPAVGRLALGWPTVAGEILPGRGHGHSHHDHDHGHDGDDGGPHPHGGRHVPPGVAPGIGELATPTGVALVRGLASSAGPQPLLVTEVLGVGAGTKNTPGRPNVVRVLIGAPLPATPDGDLPDAHDTPRSAVELAANVDDLDARLWPGVLDALLDDGALDAWLTPIVMKHGRPAVTIHALTRSEDASRLGRRIMDLTGSLGVRSHSVERQIRTRTFEEIHLDSHPIRVKVARDTDGVIVRREPEFRDVAAAARALGITEREALDRARAAAR